jgi:hypothetical protein
MREPGGELDESSRGRLKHSRRYSPLNRAPGLRRVPDEPIGRAVLSSLILHAVLVFALVRLTDGPPEQSGADISFVLADTVESVAVFTPRTSRGERPVATRSAGAKVMTRATVQNGPAAVAGASAAARERASTPPPQIAMPTAPAVPSSPPAEDGIALIPAISTAAGTREPSALSTLALEEPPDTGWSEPAPPAVADAANTQPAKMLVPVPFLRDSSQAAPAPVARATVGAKRVPTALELPERTERAAMAPATPHAAVAQTPLDAPSSPFGLGPARALVQLDGPRTRVTDQPAPTVSGRILGAAPERLVLYVNGAPTEVNPARRTFEASVPLRPGANELKAVVTGPAGIETEDTIMVQYVPRSSSKGIVLSSPPDGLTLGPDDPPVAVVEGEIDDKAAATVWIVANDRRISVAASGGRFRHLLLLPDPLVHLWAETTNGDGVHRSPAVIVRMAGARVPSGVLVMQWPTGTEESSVEVSATWRAHPDRLDVPLQSVRLPAASKTAGGGPADMFYIRGLRPGVYTLLVRYRGSLALGDVRPTLYLPDRDHLTPRVLKPVSLNGAGRTVLTKVLMPHAVHWDQEDWFSGKSESVDTVTKFRIPEGISWVERKSDLP